MRKMLIGILLIALAVSIGCGSKGNPEAEDAAVVAAKDWLSLVDAGQYAESWDEAALFFKNAVPKEHWIRTLEAVRKPFGNNVTRELRSKEYNTTLPGAPDGQYVVIQFKSSFANKQLAIETITPMLDQDGKWRVSGYYMNR